MFVTAMVYVLACVLLIESVHSDYWLLIAVAQFFISAVFLAGFILPFILYPIIAYKIYKSRRNALSDLDAAKREMETSRKELRLRKGNSSKVIPLTTQQSNMDRLAFDTK